jgi:hypothetical protein
VAELTALDRLEIMELQSIYAWGVDGKDSSVFRFAFTEDFVGKMSWGEVNGLDFWMRFVDLFHSPFDATQHHIANHWLRLDGDEVDYRSYKLTHLVAKGCPGGDFHLSGGYVLDRVVRTDDGWRIQSRDQRTFFVIGNPKVVELGLEAAAPLLGHP